VLPNIELSVFYQRFSAQYTSDSHFLACGGAVNFFKVLKGAMNLKRFKNTVVSGMHSFSVNIVINYIVLAKKMTKNMICL